LSRLRRSFTVGKSGNHQDEASRKICGHSITSPGLPFVGLANGDNTEDDQGGDRERQTQDQQIGHRDLQLGVRIGADMYPAIIFLIEILGELVGGLSPGLRTGPFLG
jgi:hypothetical protein